MIEIINNLNIKFIFDNSLIMAIIAINMTVIGLTSLADKKTIIGIDYGEFLIKEFKFMGLKIYCWLIIFALINIGNLFLMFVEKPWIRILNFIFLVFSLVFAIYYFFRFILIENKYVVKQVYIRELLGMYCDSEDSEHFYMDEFVNMNNGTRTSNKMATNIIEYFNNYNGSTQKVFIEIFGPNSVIYSKKKKMIKERFKRFKTKPYRYRESTDNEGIKEISFEFFQLFRFVENQERWALEILEILNGDESKYDIYRLYNFARLTAQIVAFGFCENLFKYKFLLYYKEYWYKTVNQERKNKPSEKETIDHIKDTERETLKCLFEYISKAINNYKNREFISMTDTVLKEIVIDNKYKGFLSTNDLLMSISEIAYKEKCIELQELIEEVISDYLCKDIEGKERINVEKIQKNISKIKKEKNKKNINKVNIF